GRAFWGAILGGMAGVFVGVPVPVVGPVIAGVLGSFAGAAAVVLWEARRPGHAARVGWGVVLGRAFAALVKTAAGVAILAIGVTSLLLRCPPPPPRASAGETAVLFVDSARRRRYIFGRAKGKTT